MPSFKNAVFTLLAAAAVASASDVTQLKKDDFDEFIKSNDIVLAECMSMCTQRVAMTPPYPATRTDDTDTYSFRPMVWPLQGPRPRVRGGRHHSEGEGNQACQDRLHRGGRSLWAIRRRGIPHPQGLPWLGAERHQCLQGPAQGRCVSLDPSHVLLWQTSTSY